MFFFFGVGVLVGRWAGLDFSGLPWAARAAVNFSYLVVCSGLALIFRQVFAIP
jgi:hypothetical protein